MVPPEKAPEGTRRNWSQLREGYNLPAFRLLQRKKDKTAPPSVWPRLLRLPQVGEVLWASNGQRNFLNIVTSRTGEHL